MPRIDDQLDAVQSQYPEDTHNPVFDVALKALGAFVPLAALANAIKEHFSGRAVNDRLNALVKALISEVQRLGKQFDSMQATLATPKFLETFLVAVNETWQTPDLERIRRFAAVLGYGLVQGTEGKAWEDLAAYIRDLSQLGDADIEALRILDSVYGDLLQRDEKPTDPNPFTERVHWVLAEVDRLRISRDEFYSRCARLNGFGLAFEVQRNISRMAPADHCFRLTGRGKRLLTMLHESAK